MHFDLYLKLYRWVSKGTHDVRLTCEEKALSDKIFFHDLSAGNLSTNHFSTVRDIDSVSSVLPKIKKSSYRLLPVVDSNDDAIGTIGQSDLITAIEHCSGCERGRTCGIKSQEAKTIMNCFRKNDFVFVTSSESVLNAIEEMNKHALLSILILKKHDERKIVGILTKQTIIDHITDRMPILLSERQQIESNPFFAKMKEDAQKLGKDSLLEFETYTPNDMINDILNGTSDEGKFYRDIIIQLDKIDGKDS